MLTKWGKEFVNKLASRGQKKGVAINQSIMHKQAASLILTTSSRHPLQVSSKKSVKRAPNMLRAGSLGLALAQLEALVARD